MVQPELIPPILETAVFLIDYVFWPISLSIVPSFILYYLTREWIKDLVVSSGSTRSRDQVLLSPKNRRNTKRLEKPKEYKTSLIVSSLLAAFAALVSYMAVLFISWHYSSYISEADAALSQVRYLTYSTLAVCIIWFYFGFYHIIKTTVESKFYRRAIHIFICLYLILKGLELAGMPIFGILNHALSSLSNLVIPSTPFTLSEDLLHTTGENLFDFIFSFFLVFFSLRYVVRILIYRHQINTDVVSFDMDAITVASDTFVFVLSIVLSVSSLEFNAIDVGLFVTLIGAGIAITFRDLLNNFSAGLLLNVDKSIATDDQIRMSNGVTGTVALIGLRATHLTTRDNIDIFVPNSVLATDTFENLSREGTRLSFKFIVGQDIDINYIENIALRACRFVPQVAATAGTTRGPQLLFLGPSELGNHFDLRFSVPDITAGARVFESEVAKVVFSQFSRANITLPKQYVDIAINDSSEK